MRVRGILSHTYHTITPRTRMVSGLAGMRTVQNCCTVSQCSFHSGMRLAPRLNKRKFGTPLPGSDSFYATLQTWSRRIWNLWSNLLQIWLFRTLRTMEKHEAVEGTENFFAYTPCQQLDILNSFGVDLKSFQLHWFVGLKQVAGSAPFWKS